MINTRTITERAKSSNEIKDRAVKLFTNDMTDIVNAIYTKNKRDNDIIAIRDGYNLAKNENPMCIIQQAGPYLWKYRDIISGSNIESLLNNDFAEEIDDIKKQKLAGNFDKFQEIMVTVRKTWTTFSTIEKETLKKKFRNMLAQYCTFLGADKVKQ